MPWEAQHDDDKSVVKVYTGGEKLQVDRQSGREYHSEFIIQDKETKEHVHIGIDDEGEVVFESRR